MDNEKDRLLMWEIASCEVLQRKSANLRTTAFGFFCTFYCFLAPGELIETSFFSIFGHVLSRLSNVINIPNLNDLVVAAWEHALLGDATWNLTVFCRLINISICTYRISVLHCPAILTHGTPQSSWGVL